MDAEKRRNAANGYVWAITLLTNGQTTDYVEKRGFENPLVGWMDGVDAAIDDWMADADSIDRRDYD
jgi:hypothetical protein